MALCPLHTDAVPSRKCCAQFDTSRRRRDSRTYVTVRCLSAPRAPTSYFSPCAKSTPSIRPCLRIPDSLLVIEVFLLTARLFSLSVGNRKHKKDQTQFPDTGEPQAERPNPIYRKQRRPSVSKKDLAKVKRPTPPNFGGNPLETGGDMRATPAEKGPVAQLPFQLLKGGLRTSSCLLKGPPR